MIKETKFSSTPFDLYDIFGYIVPGLIFLVFSITIMSVFDGDFPLKSQIFSKLHEISYEELKELKDNVPWWVEVTLLISTISIIYIIGHIIASLSSLLIDKYLVKKIAGYPSQKLFNIPFNLDFSIGFYKFMFLIINLYLVRLMFFSNPSRTEKILGGVVLTIIIIGKLSLSTKKIQNNSKLQTRLDKFGLILSWPFNFIIHFIEKSFSLNESFNDEFIGNYKTRFKELFKLELETANTNIYWLSYCYVVEKNDHMKDIIRHFLRLYGFTRNLSTSFFLLFLMILSIKLHGSVHVYRLNVAASLSLLCSLILIIRYYYLYYNYYSKFIFRAFLYLSNNNK